MAGHRQEYDGTATQLPPSDGGCVGGGGGGHCRRMCKRSALQKGERVVDATGSGRTARADPAGWPPWISGGATGRRMWRGQPAEPAPPDASATGSAAAPLPPSAPRSGYSPRPAHNSSSGGEGRWIAVVQRRGWRSPPHDTTSSSQLARRLTSLPLLLVAGLWLCR